MIFKNTFGAEKWQPVDTQTTISSKRNKSLDKLTDLCWLDDWYRWGVQSYLEWMSRKDAWRGRRFVLFIITEHVHSHNIISTAREGPLVNKIFLTSSSDHSFYYKPPFYFAFLKNRWKCKSNSKSTCLCTFTKILTEIWNVRLINLHFDYCERYITWY